MTNPTTIVLLSGGMDSATLLYHQLAEGELPLALSVDYGQRHGKELLLAERIAEHACVEHRVLDLSGLAQLLPGSSQTDISVGVPQGHYAAENMKTTVVPGRNAILLAIAMGTAGAHGAGSVSYAAHAGDHAIYPDCRPEFLTAMRELGMYVGWYEEPIRIVAPFMELTKAQIVERGAQLAVPYHLTWSCYKGLARHCGKCGTCVERREAFELAGVEDPTFYDT